MRRGADCRHVFSLTVTFIHLLMSFSSAAIWVHPSFFFAFVFAFVLSWRRCEGCVGVLTFHTGEFELIRSWWNGCFACGLEAARSAVDRLVILAVAARHAFWILRCSPPLKLYRSVSYCLMFASFSERTFPEKIKHKIDPRLHLIEISWGFFSDTLCHCVTEEYWI